MALKWLMRDGRVLTVRQQPHDPNSIEAQMAERTRRLLAQDQPPAPMATLDGGVRKPKVSLRLVEPAASIPWWVKWAALWAVVAPLLYVLVIK